MLLTSTQKEIDDMLANHLTVEEEEAVQEELFQLQASVVSCTPDEHMIQLYSFKEVDEIFTVGTPTTPGTDTNCPKSNNRDANGTRRAFSKYCSL